MQNDDNKCLKWSVLSALHPVCKHSYRVSKYKKWDNKLDEALNGIEYPVKLSDVSKFVKGTNISIKVYCHNYGNIAPLEITKEKKEKYIDLSYLTQKGKSHYCWIRNLEKLVVS